MPLFKSPEEKAAAQAQREKEKAAEQARRAREKAAEQARRAREEAARSPVGRATTARDRGNALFHIALPVDDTTARTLSQIEAIGWRLEHAGYAFKVSSTSYPNADGALASLTVGGELTGVYLFRPAVTPAPTDQ
jgi:hypothetical protein